MELNVLTNILIIFGVSVGVVIIFKFLKLPYVIAYLLTGVIVSPNTAGILHEAHEIEIYAEIGVILLLFSVGLEFSFSNLRRIQKYVLGGGSSQVLLTIIFAAISVMLITQSPLEQNIFWGFLWALSSTAIVVKVLQDQNKLNTQYGQFILGVLLFQDLIIVPMILFTPILAGQAENPWLEIAYLVGKLGLLGLISYILAKYIIPRLLSKIMTIQSQEVFLITTIFIVLGIAVLTSYMGLSLALGAFIAGLIIAETDYNRLAISCFLPFRYVFMSFFFIAIGMILDYQIFITDWPRILFWVLFAFSTKVVTGFFAAKTMKLSWKNAFIVGISMAQIGEFSFVLVQSGLEYELVSPTDYQVFLAVSIILMGASPIFVSNSEGIAKFVKKHRPAWLSSITN
ncbi:MAG: cation:proton antiporter [Cyclobacteriaceae bacterium]|nr:cation:proton antiporter [Cyclobacteriaceae bacterium HetDA_MAG_MS6]